MSFSMAVAIVICFNFCNTSYISLNSIGFVLCRIQNQWWNSFCPAHAMFRLLKRPYLITNQYYFFYLIKMSNWLVFQFQFCVIAFRMSMVCFLDMRIFVYTLQERFYPKAMNWHRCFVQSLFLFVFTHSIDNINCW